MQHQDGTKSGQAEALAAFAAATSALPPRTAALALVIGKRKAIPVRDYADASAAYDRVRLQSGQGASRLPGGVIMDGATPVAWISYNGKVWAENPVTHTYRKGETYTPLYDPYEPQRAAEQQAVDDVMEDIVQLAHETHKALGMNERDMRRHPQERYCIDILDRIAGRARSAGIDPARLLDLATRRLDKEHPRSPIVKVPDFLRDRIAA